MPQCEELPPAGDRRGRTGVPREALREFGAAETVDGTGAALQARGKLVRQRLGRAALGGVDRLGSDKTRLVAQRFAESRHVAADDRQAERAGLERRDGRGLVSVQMNERRAGRDEFGDRVLEGRLPAHVRRVA